jgi:ribosomal protein S11
MLRRSGVDYSVLLITDDPVVWRDVETGERTTSVIVRGPENARRAAFHALFDRGLSVAPYPDLDYYSRRGGGVAR